MTGLTSLKDAKVSVGDLIKWTLTGLPSLITIIVALVSFSRWSERVDLRLDDMDRDLRAIHLQIQQKPAYPQLDSYQLKPDAVENN